MGSPRWRVAGLAASALQYRQTPTMQTMNIAPHVHLMGKRGGLVMLMGCVSAPTGRSDANGHGGRPSACDVFRNLNEGTGRKLAWFEPIVQPFVHVGDLCRECGALASQSQIDGLPQGARSLGWVQYHLPLAFAFALTLLSFAFHRRTVQYHLPLA